MKHRGPRATERVSTVRTTDPAEAEATVAATYQVPSRLILPAQGLGDFQMNLTETGLATSTTGLLSFGVGARVVTGRTSGFHVNLTLRGRATGAADGAPPVTASPGEALVYGPGAVTDAHWSPGCRVLTLLLPQRVLEDELESLLGHRLREPLRPEPRMEADAVAQALAPALPLVVAQLERPTPVSATPAVQRHVEALLVDSFLLAHRHNYSDELHRPVPSAVITPIERATQLLEERADEPWTTVTLASEVHLSVRALQDGFKRHHDCPPMTYLRRVRLRRAYETLRAARPGETTVQEVALTHGLLHLGRFSVSYREEFGESPSTTLARPVP